MKDDYKLNLEYLKDEVFKCNIPSYLINYLYSLLYLDIFAINDYINKEDKELLNKISIYKNVVIYNIVNRIKNLKDSNGDVINKSDRINLLYLNKDIITFSYHKSYTENKNYIGTFILNDYEDKEGLINILKQEIKKVSESINPYSKINKESYHLWQYEHLECLHKLTSELKQVENIDRDKLKLINEYYKDVIKKLGIKLEDFTLIKEEPIKRTLVKESSSIPMINYINYR